MNLDDLELSVRAYNCLKRAGINTVEELCNRTMDDMMRVRNLGIRCLKEIIEIMKTNGLKFKDEKANNIITASEIYGHDTLMITKEEYETMQSEISSLKASLEFNKALADVWESNAQSGLNLVHKYRELLTGAREELKSYKDAEEQGLLLRLPCKAGDTFLYEPMDKDTVHKLKVTGYRTIQGDWVVETSFGPVPFLCIGKTVFLTREAAEEALKGSGAE
jgi:hypothetical protein